MILRGLLPFGGVDVLWSRGAFAHCDFSGPPLERFRSTERVSAATTMAKFYSGASGLVWVRLSTRAREGVPCNLDHFVEQALPTIEKPFVLITTDGDATVPSDLRPDTVARLLDNRFLVAWYTQNFDGFSHPKLRPFPIGLDLHSILGGLRTPRQRVELLRKTREARREAGTLPLRVFCDLGINRNSPDRRDLGERLAGVGHVDFLAERVSQRRVWERYAAYPFVLSAHGNGLDCHRTWEVLYLGGIVITRTSSLDALYDGLPVAIVKDWGEVASLENLERWRDTLAPLTDRARIWNRLSSKRLFGDMRDRLAEFGR